MKEHSHIRALLLITGLLLSFGTHTTVKAQFRIAPSTNLEDSITCYSGGRESIRLVEKSFTFLDNNTEAQKILDKIAGYVEELDATIETVPILRKSLRNAEACASDKGRRYILYNRDWLLGIYNHTGSKWAIYAIIAHELGHFVLNHHLRGYGSKPELEKEADRYAGKLLARMGASVEEAQSAYHSEEMKNTQGPTHPPISKRLEEVKRGFEEARFQQINESGSTKSTSIQPSPTSNTNKTEASGEARRNPSESIPRGPVEKADIVYKGGPKNEFRFRFKTDVVQFNSDDDLRETASKITNKSGSTHVWNNKLYYWTKGGAKDRLLLAWQNLTTDKIGWVIVDKVNSTWFYKTNGDDGEWTNLKQGEQKAITWNSSGQKIKICLNTPKPNSNWTTEDIQYSFGYSN